MRLTSVDHARVTAAVSQAEAATNGEIVTVVAARSDAYHDVAAHWAVVAMLSVLTLLAIRPDLAEAIHARVVNDWTAPSSAGGLFTVALVLVALAFLIARLILAPAPVRMALTPGSTKARRVHRRALDLFRTGAEKRTRAATAVLLYLSLAERRAEIIADEAIHSRVGEEVWGDAMKALLAAVREGHVADGMTAAVEQIGVVLARHFPHDADDTNELPDRLIEL